MYLLRNFFLLLGLATLPIYIFPSGFPQPSHMLLLLFFVCSLAEGKVVLCIEDWLLGALFLLSLTRESFAIINGEEVSSIIHPVFTLFNLCLVVFIRNFFLQSHTNERQCFTWGICIAAFIATLNILISGFSFSGNDTIIRSIGAFNNPNQVAYFAVCLGAITLTLYLSRMISIPIAVLCFIAGLVLIFASLSKAGLIGFALVLFVFCLSFTLRAIRVFSVIAIPASLVYILNAGYLEHAYAFQRLRSIGTDTDDTLYERGYLMFQYFKTPIDILFGLGSGKAQAILTHEVHSTLMYNLVNYSLFGFLFYTGFLTVWAIRSANCFGVFAMFGIVGAPMLYGLAHNGTRFTMFYVLIACGLSLTRKITS
jgi:hypothetical protein